MSQLYVKRWVRALGVALGVLILMTRPASAQLPTEPKAVWIDADPACGQSFWQDVDDCFAITQALYSPQLAVRGISVVHGNGTGQSAMITARDLLNRLNNKTPLFIGYQLPFSSPAALTELNRSRSVPDAVWAMAQALRNERLTLIALGPLTNIAALIQIYPELIEQIESVVMLGGLLPQESYWIYPSDRLPMRDFNIIKDPVAAAYVVNTAVPVKAIPVKAAFNALITQQDLDALGKDKRYAQLVEDSSGWMSLWTTAFGTDGFPPFDSLAVLLTSNPEWFACKTVQPIVKERSSTWGSQWVVEHHTKASSTQAPLMFERCLLKPNRPPWRTVLTASTPQTSRAR